MSVWLHSDECGVSRDALAEHETWGGLTFAQRFPQQYFRAALVVAWLVQITRWLNCRAENLAYRWKNQ